jgi:hypothetical protein
MSIIKHIETAAGNLGLSTICGKIYHQGGHSIARYDEGGVTVDYDNWMPEKRWGYIGLEKFCSAKNIPIKLKVSPEGVSRMREAASGINSLADRLEGLQQQR